MSLIFLQQQPNAGSLGFKNSQLKPFAYRNHGITLPDLKILTPMLPLFSLRGFQVAQRIPPRLLQVIHLSRHRHSSWSPNPSLSSSKTERSNAKIRESFLMPGRTTPSWHLPCTLYSGQNSHIAPHPGTAAWRRTQDPPLYTYSLPLGTEIGAAARCLPRFAC